jgi:hypothetical protein
MATPDSVIVTMRERVDYEITLSRSRLAELLGIDIANVAALLADVRGWKPAPAIENNLLIEIDRDKHRTGSKTRKWGLRTSGPPAPPPATSVITDLADLADGIRAAAAVLCERRTRELIAEGSSDEEALHHASTEAVHYARGLIQDSESHNAVRQLVDTYLGNTYRLLRDLADHLGASVAYVDRATVEAHLERTLSADEWAAINDQFRAMDFDEHIGDQQTFRTDWIETVLKLAGVAGFGRRTPAHQVDANIQQSDGGAAA